jgi:hypothetical protein
MDISVMHQGEIFIEVEECYPPVYTAVLAVDGGVGGTLVPLLVATVDNLDEAVSDIMLQHIFKALLAIVVVIDDDDMVEADGFVVLDELTRIAVLPAPYDAESDTAKICMRSAEISFGPPDLHLPPFFA